MKTLSVIIPALNEAAGIALAIERAWALGAAEVLVIDGGSHDATVALAQPGATHALSSPPGRARQQNLGAKHATGDVLLFLHADSWLAPAGGQQISDALANPRVQCGAFRQQIEAAGRAYRLLEWGNAWRARWQGVPYGDQGLFFRRSFFHELGGFAEVRFLEDLLIMRAARRRAWPVLLPGPLHTSPRRWQQHGVIRQTLRNWSILAAWQCGVSPDRLATFYRPPGK